MTPMAIFDGVPPAAGTLHNSLAPVREYGVMISSLQKMIVFPSGDQAG